MLDQNICVHSIPQSAVIGVVDLLAQCKMEGGQTPKIVNVLLAEPRQNLLLASTAPNGRLQYNHFLNSFPKIATVFSILQSLLFLSVCF